jgi:hypothetical protein
MSHLLTSGMVGNIGMNHMKVIRLETQSKWDSLGFLEGQGHVKENIAQLYENQASTLLSESTTANQVLSKLLFSQLYVEYSLNY